MGVGLLLGMLGSDAAYQTVFKQVLENYNKEFDPTFKATDAMVENVRAEPINKTRPRILEYPLLRDGVDYHFPIMVIYGERDIYGRSKEHVRSRFPRATFAEIENAGHIAWRHNKDRFFGTLSEFYQLE
jgi:proline iminopeptidase